MRKSTVFLFGFFAFIVIILIISHIINTHQTTDKTFTKSIPAEYLNLFTSRAKAQFDVLGTKKMDSGLPVSSLIYTYISSSGGAYGHIIELFKDSLKEDMPLNEIIQISRNNSVKDSDTGLIELREGGFDLKYKDGKDKSISKVNWNFNGDIFRLIKATDNLLYYDIRFKNFDIRYNNGKEILAHKTDFFFLHETGKFIFLKKHKILYTIFISDTDLSPSRKDTVLSLLNTTQVN